MLRFDPRQHVIIPPRLIRPHRMDYSDGSGLRVSNGDDVAKHRLRRDPRGDAHACRLAVLQCNHAKGNVKHQGEHFGSQPGCDERVLAGHDRQCDCTRQQCRIDDVWHRSY